MHFCSMEFWLQAGLLPAYKALYYISLSTSTQCHSAFFIWKVLLPSPSFLLFIPLFKNNYSLSFYLCCLPVFFHCTDNYQWIQERWVVGSCIFEQGSKSQKNPVHNSARLTIGSSKDHYFLPSDGRGQHPCH